MIPGSQPMMVKRIEIATSWWHPVFMNAATGGRKTAMMMRRKSQQADMVVVVAYGEDVL
jgi:hypothetical protein